MKDRDSMFLYMAQLLHEGEYNSGISWKQFKIAYEFVSDENSADLVSELRRQNRLGDFSDNDSFIYFPTSDVEVKDEDLNVLLSKIANLHPAIDISMAFRLEPSLVDLILSSNLYSGDSSWDDLNRALIPIILSPRFLNDRRTQIFIDELLRNSKENFNFKKYETKRWFIELAFMIKRGLYGNGGYSYVSGISDARRTALINGSYDLLVSGGLYELILRFRSIVTESEFGYRMKKFQKLEKISTRISHIYSYLSIGNDILIGIEFLLGSFEFLPRTIFPSANEVIGVYLFIAGSAELLIRPMIEISRRIHLRIINGSDL